MGGESWGGETYPICAWQRLTVDTQGAERRVRGQAFVPLAGPLLRDGLHEVPLQLADAGVVPQQVFLGLIELLHSAKSERGTGQESVEGWGWFRTIRGGKIRGDHSG